MSRVAVAGATGTIGRAAVAALLARGHSVLCFVRSGSVARARQVLPEAAEIRGVDMADPAALGRDGFRGERVDALVSCLASRTGAPEDAWAVDHRATVAVMEAAKAAGAGQVVLLSAICVQRPKLAFQEAKLAAEAAVMASGLTWSIVRPTAFFKSLSGQVERVRAGKPFLVFGDGRLTACKPISDRDLAEYLADCLEREDLQNRILPIGGPGPAITPAEQGARLAELTGQPVRLRRVPVAVLDAVIAGLSIAGKVSRRARDKAELARIGRYYATESMLVLDPETGRYDAEATPETGQDRLFDYYAQLVSGEETAERGDHAVF